MTIPTSNQINVTLTVTADASGNLQYAWSGSTYCDKSGNLTLTQIKGEIQITITISTSLQLSYCTPAAQTMWLGLASAGKPTKPYSGGTEFTAPAFVNNSAGVLQWNDTNSDGNTYQYVLLLWLVSAQYPRGVQIQVDPRIVNRGTSG
ncbi:MAG TPA: hypothetical protein VFV97_14550 [Rhodanobacteraceae bacterium]|nr:hypothetical protein [Rhodanobacteraceae bacterium]